jgi:peptidoglycan hydrolase CwlO-like protein
LFSLTNLKDELFLIILILSLAILSYFNIFIIDKWIIIVSLILVVFLGKSFAIDLNAKNIKRIHDEKIELQEKVELLENKIIGLEEKIEKLKE